MEAVNERKGGLKNDPRVGREKRGKAGSKRLYILKVRFRDIGSN